MLWPASIIVDGTAIPLAELLADVTIHTGRAGINDEPTASTCQITILDVGRDFVEAFRVGVPLEVTVTTEPGHPPAPPNLCANGDFESDLTGWTNSGAAAMTHAPTGKYGKGALQLVNAAAGADHFANYQAAGLAGGKTYTVSAWVNAEGFTAPAVQSRGILIYDLAGAKTTQVLLTAPAAGWQKLSVSITMSAAGGALNVRLYAPQGTVQWDGVQIQEGAATVEPDLPRFAGTVTDARLDDDVLTVIAAARLATLQIPIGLDAEGVWPVEPWSARLARIFASAGLPELLVAELDPTFDPPLAARDPATAGATTLANYLAFLAPMVGAAVADLPDGTILVQAIGARTIDSRLDLDPAQVAYVPAWTQVLPAGNIVAVRYTGDQSESVTVADDASRGFYGDRPRTIDTTFTQAADATRRANTALARGAYAHWNMPEAPVLAGLELRVGQPVTLSQMPPSSPFEPWTPIVEGWTDEISGNDWTMLLALSDPFESGLILPWQAVPVEPAYQWDTVDTQTDWTEALSLDALNAG